MPETAAESPPDEAQAEGVCRKPRHSPEVRAGNGSMGATEESSSINAQSGSAPAPPSHCRDDSDEEGGDEAAGAAGPPAPEGADTARAEIR